MIKEIFVCSKPLQYFNLLNVVKTMNCNSKKTLIIIGYFSNSKSFYRNVCRINNEWNRVLYVNNKYLSYLYLLFLSANNVYVEIENSTILGIVHFVKRFNVFVFEEGIATYLPHLYKKKSIINFLDRLLGVGDSYCTSTYLKGLFLYKPEVYRRIMNNSTAVLFQFRYDFISLLKMEQERLLSIFDIDYDHFPLFKISNKKILLYLTEWNVDCGVLKDIDNVRNSYDYVFIKPHPNNKVLSSELEKYDIISTPIMAEVLIAILLNNNNELTLYHHGSTSSIYFVNKLKSVVYPTHDDSIASFEGFDVNSISEMFL